MRLLNNEKRKGEKSWAFCLNAFVKYHFFKSKKAAEKKQERLAKRGIKSTIYDVPGNTPTKKGYPVRLNEYKKRKRR